MEQYLSVLLSPIGAIAALVGFAFLLLVVARLRNSLLVLIIMLFVGSLAVSVDVTNDAASTATWLMPLQQQRTPIYLYCGTLLALNMLVHIGEIRVASTTSTGLLITLVAAYAGLIQCIHLGFIEGVLSVISAMLTLGALSMLLPSLIRSWEDICVLLRTISLTALIYAAAVLIQLVINRTPLVAVNAFRFQGISGNPQFVAVFLAVATTATVFLIFNDPQKRFKPLYVALTCLMVVLLGWTGSRTGALMTVIGLSSVFYSRMGKVILFAPIALGGIFGIVQVMESMGIQLGFDRLTSSQDTRSSAWAALIQTALENPVFGAGTSGAGAAENSFLLAAASFGFGSLFTLLLLLAGVAVQCVRLFIIRGRVDPVAKRVVDLQIGFFAMFFAGAMFEGYIIARVNVMLPLFLIFSAITTRLLEFESESRAAGGRTADDPPAGVLNHDAA